MMWSLCLSFTSSIFSILGLLHNQASRFQIRSCQYFIILSLEDSRVSHVALVVKKPPANAGDLRDSGSVPGLGSSPGAVHGNPLWYYCLENPMDGGAWSAAAHRGTQSGGHERINLAHTRKIQTKGKQLPIYLKISNLILNLAEDGNRFRGIVSAFSSVFLDGSYIQGAKTEIKIEM